ncbi:MAG: hypothetical protein HY766_08935, partial [candidate division NC10 bacterium]|nr:hypothetical protein [candidate division NC10 bacterium]
MQESWTDTLVTLFREMARRLALVAPRLLALLTRILRSADFDGRCRRWGLTASLARGGIKQPPTELVGRAIFWTLFLVALLMGIEALETPATAGLVAVLLRFLPNLIVAALVMVAGWVLANFLAQAALIGAVNAQVAGAPLIAAAVRWLVLVFAGSAALTQLGIAREMVLLTFGIALGGT